MSQCSRYSARAKGQRPQHGAFAKVHARGTLVKVKYVCCIFSIHILLRIFENPEPRNGTAPDWNAFSTRMCHPSDSMQFPQNIYLYYSLLLQRHRIDICLMVDCERTRLFQFDRLITGNDDCKLVAAL